MTVNHAFPPKIRHLMMSRGSTTLVEIATLFGEGEV